MEHQRSIDGVQYCLTETYSNQAVYEPCPPPNTAAALGFSTIAVLMVLTVVWVIPEVTRRRSQYESAILAARRSL